MIRRELDNLESVSVSLSRWHISLKSSTDTFEKLFPFLQINTWYIASLILYRNMRIIIIIREVIENLYTDSKLF